MTNTTRFRFAALAAAVCTGFAAAQQTTPIIRDSLSNRLTQIRVERSQANVQFRGASAAVVLPGASATSLSPIGFRPEFDRNNLRMGVQTGRFDAVANSFPGTPRPDLRNQRRVFLSPNANQITVFSVGRGFNAGSVRNANGTFSRRGIPRRSPIQGGAPNRALPFWRR
ncbi:MAG: hypothetical protein AAGI17_00340 [Planctomycetota bacterium]